MSYILCPGCLKKVIRFKKIKYALAKKMREGDKTVEIKKPELCSVCKQYLSMENYLDKFKYPNVARTPKGRYAQTVGYCVVSGNYAGVFLRPTYIKTIY